MGPRVWQDSTERIIKELENGNRGSDNRRWKDILAEEVPVWIKDCLEAKFIWAHDVGGMCGEFVTGFDFEDSDWDRWVQEVFLGIFAKFEKWMKDSSTSAVSISELLAPGERGTMHRYLAGFVTSTQQDPECLSRVLTTLVDSFEFKSDFKPNETTCKVSLINEVEPFIHYRRLVRVARFPLRMAWRRFLDQETAYESLLHRCHDACRWWAGPDATGLDISMSLLASQASNASAQSDVAPNGGTISAGELVGAAGVMDERPLASRTRTADLNSSWTGIQANTQPTAKMRYLLGMCTESCSFYRSELTNAPSKATTLAAPTG